MNRDIEKRIVEVLKNYGELNVTRISRLTEVSFKTLNKYLKKMVDDGVLEERRYGRLRLFRLKRT